MDTKDYVFQYIEEYLEEKRYPPTRREIAEALDISVSTVQYHVKALVLDGLIAVVPKISRGITINESS